MIKTDGTCPVLQPSLYPSSHPSCTHLCTRLRTRLCAAPQAIDRKRLTYLTILTTRKCVVLQSKMRGIAGEMADAYTTKPSSRYLLFRLDILAGDGFNRDKSPVFRVIFICKIQRAHLRSRTGLCEHYTSILMKESYTCKKPVKFFEQRHNPALSETSFCLCKARMQIRT